jgi:hypothetical protein
MFRLTYSRSAFSFPTSDLLSQFRLLTPKLRVLTAQIDNFLAQLKNFATKLPHQISYFSWLSGQMRIHKRVLHDQNACNPDLTLMKRPTAFVCR